MKIKVSNLIIIIVIVVGVFCIISNFRKNNEGKASNSSETQANNGVSEIQSDDENKPKENVVKIDEEMLKKAVVIEQDGIEISQVNIKENENNIVKLSLNVKNNANEKKNVDLAVVFYNANQEEIGRNGFSVGVLDAEKTIYIENNCYISQLDVADIKLEAKVEAVKEEEIKDTTNGDGTATDITTSSTVPETANE